MTADGSARSAAEERALLDNARLVLIDLDGCIAFGGEPHPAAAALLRRFAGRCAILSNNSSETPEGLAAALAARGLAIDPQRALLAGAVMIDVLAAEHSGRRICLLASAAIRAYARARGLRLSATEAEIVALARDTSLSYRKLDRAVACLRRGAALIVSNPDLTHPGADGRPVPETGAILQMFRACLPGLAFTVVGKPSRRMFDAALARFDGAAGSTVMIGDNAETDGAGALAAGITPILLGPGRHHASIADLL